MSGTGEDDYYRQSTTACCPRETIPDSCSCPDGCQCMCTNCVCEGWGDDGYLDHSPGDEYLIYPQDRTTYGDSYAY